MKSLFPPRHIAALLLVCGWCVCASGAEMRIFIDRDGKTLKGELVSIAGSTVTIKGADGQTYTRSADSFCQADIDYFHQNGLKPADVPASDAAEPPELTAARQRYHLQLDQASAPIKQRYLPYLESLKKAKGAKGDLPAAVAVQKEIDGVAKGELPEMTDGPQELKDARARYERELGKAVNPIKLAWANGLEKFKKTLGAKGDLKGAMAVQNELDGLEMPVAYDVRGTRIVIWNQHNGDRNDRGTKRINLVLTNQGREVWRKDGVAIPWKANQDTKLEIMSPEPYFDTIHVDVVESVANGGGLAEIECFVDGVNVAKGCRVTSNGAYGAPSTTFGPEHVVDGITTSKTFESGYWLAPEDQHPAWIEVHLNQHGKKK